MQLYKRRFRHRGLLVMLAVFIALIALFAVVLGQTAQTADHEQATLLEKAIRNAVVSCYAIEGRYPDTLEKIIRDYGVVIDDQRFIVRYDIFADNIMPDISIMFKGERAT